MLMLPARATNKIRVFSYGAGVQSFAALILQAQGKFYKPFDAFVFANVGNDSEKKKTLEHYRNVALPFAEAHGIRLIEVQKTRFKETDTVYQSVMRENKSVPIPMYMSGGSPGNRTCTQDFKILVVNRWIKSQGYTHAQIGIGFTIDEQHRREDGDENWFDKFGNKPFGFQRAKEFPLSDLLLTRFDCDALIHRAGLPLPPKSSCWFCPFQSRGEWIEMKKHDPEQFAQAVALEKRANEKRANLKKDMIFLHRDRKPLAEAVPDQMSLWDDYMDTDESCTSGYCGI